MLGIEPYGEDEDLIAAVRADGGVRVRITRPLRPVVVLGRSGDPDVELHVEALRRDGATVQRRRGGGCAVLLDPGNLVVSVVAAVPGLAGIHPHFRAMSRWIGEALGELGVHGVEQRGISDLAVDERKIGGSCIFRAKDLLYYSTTLLVEPQIRLMERYLRHPPREPAYRAGRPHRAFVAALGHAPWRLTTAAVHDALSERLTPGTWERHRP
jgi:lipoate-protein ligase A